MGKPANELPGPLLIAEKLPSLTNREERALSLDLARDEDKVGGWPWTPEALELPRCATCREPMQLVLQLVSGDNINFIAGSKHGAGLRVAVPAASRAGHRAGLVR